MSGDDCTCSELTLVQLRNIDYNMLGYYSDANFMLSATGDSHIVHNAAAGLTTHHRAAASTHTEPISSFR